MGKNRIVFRNILFAIVSLEIASFIAYVNPRANPWIFGIAAIAIIIATARKLEWGIYIVFAELIVGSLGRELVLHFDGKSVSIRMAIWIIVITVWAAHAIKDRRVSFFKSRLFPPFAILALAVGWGAVWGMIQGNGFGAFFQDANNYLYFALIFPVYGVLRSRRAVERLHYALCAAVAWLSLKTIALFYVFSHEFFILQDVLYGWLRWSRLAEITNIDPNALLSRVFMQSHIWLLFLLFLYVAIALKNIVPFICKSSTYKDDKDDIEERESRIEYQDKIMSKKVVAERIFFLLFLIVASQAALVMSFSRSFWLAGIISFLFFLVVYFLRRLRKKRLKKFFVFAGLWLVLIAVSIGFTMAVAWLPVPKGTSSASLLRERAGKLTAEAAVSSRWSQIGPLFGAIAKHPVIGSGFGTSVTYESQDPRVLKNHPDRKYTTTAFELGWLEIWLKLGLIGIFAYVYLLYQICKIGLDSVKQIPSGKIKKYALAGLCVGLIALALTHGVSPYLNHPLGIGIVILCASLVERKYIKKTAYV